MGIPSYMNTFTAASLRCGRSYSPGEDFTIFTQHCVDRGNHWHWRFDVFQDFQRKREEGEKCERRERREEKGVREEGREKCGELFFF
jgi:hypothetical protein